MSGIADLDSLEREVIDHLFALQPGYAVTLGVHEYDGRLPDLSRTGTDRWVAAAKGLFERLERVDPAGSGGARKADKFLLRLLLEGAVFDLTGTQDYDRNPMVYVGAVSLTPYITRAYAPATVRVGRALEILRAAPRLLEQGRSRLHTVLPRPFVELAIIMGEGLPAHLDEAESFAEMAGRGTEFAAARAPVQAEIAGFVAWLRDEVLPRAVPEFALGPELFQRLLFVREGVTAPYEEVRRAGAADLARNQARLAAIAAAEGVSVSGLFDRMNGDHPTSGELLPAARATVEEAREFVRRKNLVTVPDATDWRVEETPIWGRALTTASMDCPGPFESGSAQGIYYVTPVDPQWTPRQQDEWLRSLNRAVLRNNTIHEVFPGHYLQFLHLRATALSLARKVYLSSSFTEGWAHYTEQLAIEEGIGAGNAIAEVAQIHDALLRDCRLLATIGLHTGGWTLERATQLFEREGHFARLPAEREALRGTYDPGYFCYTLGKLAILDARRNHLTSAFGGDLRAFHDAVLGLGAPPIGLLDELLRSHAGFPPSPRS